jgi:hypothetical protein
MAKYSDPARYPYSAFDPSPELDIDDADVILMYIGNNRVHYGQPVNGPVFSAHKKITYKSYGVQDEAEIYYHDNPGTVLGCTEQVSYSINHTLLHDLTHYSTNIA